MAPTRAKRTRTIGMTDQKMRARKVESPFAQLNPLIVHLLSCSAFSIPRSLDIHTLEGVFDADGRDEVRPEPLASVERELDIGIEEKGTEYVPLRAKAKLNYVIPNAIPVRLPAAEDVEREGQPRMHPSIKAYGVDDIVLLRARRRHLVA